jgi:hypothetical protein
MTPDFSRRREENVVDVLRVSPGRRMAHLQEQEQSKDILKQK